MKTPRFDARSLVTSMALLALASACATRPASVRPQGGAAADTVHQVRFTGDFHEPLGVQLWTFRDQAKTDPRGMLQMVRRMGFTHVETAGLYDLSAQQFADAVKQANLRVTSMNVGYAKAGQPYGTGISLVASVAGTKVPSPLPSNTVIVSSFRLSTAKSGMLSPLKSATATPNATVKLVAPFANGPYTT